MALTVEKQVQKSVILAGSGRSGTSWLGAILNSYERSEYFYEITAFDELEFGRSDLLKIKYPLTHAWAGRPDWAARLDRRLLAFRAKRGPGQTQAERSLRIFADHRFHKERPDVFLYKIVTLYGFVQRRRELAERFGDQLKVVHLIRNPYAQIASELRIDARDPDRSRLHFRSRVEQILDEEDFGVYHDAARHALNRGWVAQMALVWRVSNEVLDADRLFEKRMVVYEDLCTATVQVVDELFAFLGWQVSDQTRAYIDQTTNVSVSESGHFSLRKNASESMTRWRNELGEDMYAESQDMLRDSPLLGLWERDALALAT